MSPIVFLIVPLAAIFGARVWLWHVLSRASDVPTIGGMTGAEIAVRLLAANGLGQVAVERTDCDAGSDHYDPRDRAIRLSADVHDTSSVHAVAIAAHEVGHAVQDARRTLLFRARAVVAPVASAASISWVLVFFVGAFVFQSAGLIALAVLLYMFVVLFEVVTLPVEIDASRRAMRLISAEGLLVEAERPLARSVLRAAALTYVVVAFTAVLQLIQALLEGED
jgi:uncharacterized protein